MKTNVTSLLLVSAVIVGCGSGGGGDDSYSPDGPSDRQVCQGYCDYSCQKAANCLAIVDPSGVAQCGDICLDTIERNGGANANSCSDATNIVADMSCGQLLDFLDLSRKTARSSENVVPGEAVGVAVLGR